MIPHRRVTPNGDPWGSIVRIDPRFAAPAAPALGNRPREGTGTARFSLEGDSATRTGGSRAAAPLGSMDAILALQAEEDAGERKRRSARRGLNILGALDDLKAGLLFGRVAPAEIDRIARGLREAAGASGDPGLDSIVAEIELRAKVELAKLGRADLA
jgi:hypothetical protein